MGFDAEWARCKGYIEAALDSTAWTVDAVEQEIRARRAVLWPFERSAVVTQIHLCPKGRVLKLWIAGGDLNELLRFLPAADNYAREQGCFAVEAEGRPGWERVLKGYGKRRVSLMKEL